MHKETNGFTRTLAYVFGFGIGGLWILLAVASLLSAANGVANDRWDWGLGWGLVGFLLLVAGSISIAGTWWHQTHVRHPH